MIVQVASSVTAIAGISCLRSDVRRGRAWLRLSLESKHLSTFLQHLFGLLSCHFLSFFISNFHIFPVSFLIATFLSRPFLFN